MTDHDRPEAFGVFKPVGHVLIAFPREAQLQAAVADLAAIGIAEDALVRYPREQMRAQVERDVSRASPLASLGQELNLVKAHGELAEQGHSFLVVPAADRDATEAVARIARSHGAIRAQKYGQFVIEDLIDASTGESQTFESPERGLDAETRSGRGEDRGGR